MRQDPERFVTFVLGAFMLAYYAGLAVQTARVWRRVGRCPIVAFTEGGLGNLLHAAAAVSWPLPVLAWAHCPGCFEAVPRIAALESWPIRLIGLLCLCASAAVLRAAAAELGDAWRMGVESGPPPRLIQSGIYGAVRHPMYASGWLALFGIFLLAPNLLFAILWGAGSSGILVLAEREERELAARLGPEFENYRRFTGRFFPYWY